MTKINNYLDIAISQERKIVLDVLEAGLEAIDTKEIIYNNLYLKDNTLFVQGQNFDLSLFERIKVVGFGKAACDAAIALEKVLGDKIKEGAVIGLNKITCSFIETFTGTHPVPSKQNILPGKRIYEIIENSNEKDLIIVIVSGGGSALLCYPAEECIQGEKLYEHFLKSGQTIIEINTIRKHLSLLKGGGLAKIAYPATIIGLIFSDVPGDDFAEVASGPTYKDETTKTDAQKIIDQYNLGSFDLIETPKEDKYFEKVYNFVCVSNKTAIMKMAERVENLGLKAKILSTEFYDEVGQTLEDIFSAQENNTVVLSAGEPKLKVFGNKGSGGRNLYMSLRASKFNDFNNDLVFLSFASDGMDNSDAAGAFFDRYTLEKLNQLGVNINEYLDNFDAYSVFRDSKDLIFTGPTGANVSDLMILFKNNE